MKTHDAEPKRHLGLVMLTLGVVLTSALSLHAGGPDDVAAAQQVYLAAEARDVFLAGAVWLSLIAGLNFLMAFILGMTQRIEDDVE